MEKTDRHLQECPECGKDFNTDKIHEKYDHRWSSHDIPHIKQMPNEEKNKIHEKCERCSAEQFTVCGNSEHGRNLICSECGEMYKGIKFTD